MCDHLRVVGDAGLGDIDRRAFLAATIGVTALGACSVASRVSSDVAASASTAGADGFTATRGWYIGANRWAPGSVIAGYSGRDSVLPGEPIPLHVSTSADEWRVRAFRIGHYDGLGGALVAKLGPFKGERQSGPRTDSTTRMVDAPWRKSVEIDTAGWEPGHHVIHLIAGDKIAYVPVMVRSSDVAGRVIVVASSTTMAAYNLWGGRNLYGNEAKAIEARSYAVSLDRPMDSAQIPFMMSYDIALARAADAAGVPLAWMTNIDIALDPDRVKGSRGLVSPGHDEYWPLPYRAALVGLREDGANLAFTGANAGYWRVRLAETDLGPGRRVVCYKSATLDPKGGGPDTTARWRDAPDPKPENQVVGQLYDAFPASGDMKITDPDFFLFRDTGVREGDTFGALIGDESDRFYPNDDTPRPIQLPAVSPAMCRDKATWSTVAYYTTRSGAGVFSTGTMNWTRALPRENKSTMFTDRTKRFVLQVTKNMVASMSEGPMGLAHPARDDSDRVHLPANNTTGSA